MNPASAASISAECVQTSARSSVLARDSTRFATPVIVFTDEQPAENERRPMVCVGLTQPAGGASLISFCAEPVLRSEDRQLEPTPHAMDLKPGVVLVAVLDGATSLPRLCVLRRRQRPGRHYSCVRRTKCRRSVAAATESRRRFGAHARVGCAGRSPGAAMASAKEATSMSDFLKAERCRANAATSSSKRTRAFPDTAKYRQPSRPARRKTPQGTIDCDGLRRPLVQGRHRLSAPRQELPRRERRRLRRFPRADGQARLHPRPRREHDLAAAVLSVAAARRRLRHRRRTRRSIRRTARIDDFRALLAAAHDRETSASSPSW